MRPSARRFPLLASCLLLPTTLSAAPYSLSPVQVTASQASESVEETPLAISVIDGEELRARGITDLAGALALIAGVNAARGGDAGPASVVPGLLGQREADDFLLVVDGVPLGGATTPTFEAVDLTNVERIEVQRGLAPIYFGTLAFAGTVQVIHYAAGKSSRVAEAYAGLYGTKGADLAAALPSLGGWRQSIGATIDHQGYSDPRAGADRYQALYRGGADLAGGSFGLDVSLMDLRQNPLSPTPLNDSGLASRVAIDANNNPADARINEYRSQLSLRFDRPFDTGSWDSSLSLTHTISPVIQGFLDSDGDCAPKNACGYSQLKRITEVFADSHVRLTPAHGLAVTLGANEVYGYGRADNTDFGYSVVQGQIPLPSTQADVQDTGASTDLRSLFGVYAQSEWHALRDVVLHAGIRENLTQEDRAIYDDEDGNQFQNQHKSRASGGIGLDWHAIHGNAFSAAPYVSFANTFQPSQFDFSPDPDNAALLQPESAESLQFGVKGGADDGRIEWDLAAFDVHFDNRVISQSIGGEPTLVNGGQDRYEGLESELKYALTDHLQLSANYAYNDSRYRNFLVADDDGSANEQLSGNRLPLTPMDLAAVGVLYNSSNGFNTALLGNYVGPRFLDQENTIRAKSFMTLDGKLGYRFGALGVVLTGNNLTNRRDPVIASEIGDGQVYRLGARQILLQLQWHY